MSGSDITSLLSIFLRNTKTLCDRILHSSIESTTPSTFSPLPNTHLGHSRQGDMMGDILAEACAEKPILRAGRFRESFVRLDSHSNHPLHEKFIRTIAEHFVKLLRIEGLHQLLSVPKVTNDEIEDHYMSPSNRNFLSADGYHYNFEQERDSAFNAESIYIFAQDFQLRVLWDGWYQPPIFPRQFLELDYIEFTLFRHLEYVNRVYRGLKDPTETSQIILQKVTARRRTRKYKKYKARESHILATPRLRRHHAIYKHMGIGSVSSEETDSETEEGADKRLKLISPAWRSWHAAAFHHAIDDNMAKTKRAAIQTASGFTAFHRCPSDWVDTTTMPPKLLPQNCIDVVWMNSLRPSQSRALRIKEENYPFDPD
ncbi:hypothetical protein OF83DRAFT_1177467 [Amylostereum chailletii]|nr:hypothetical protein OF83DRAFT_1177467 [Amylostereum chailletii]